MINGVLRVWYMKVCLQYCQGSSWYIVILSYKIIIRGKLFLKGTIMIWNGIAIDTCIYALGSAHFRYHMYQGIIEP